MPDSQESRCGLVAIIGRPNVGKSTFLNCVLGQKISITSRKPQTTRYQILGIKTIGNSQIIYIDTPGLDNRRGRALNRCMNREAMRALADVDVVIFMIEAMHWTDTDQYVLDKLKSISSPVILAINKVDRIGDKSRLLPFLSELGKMINFAEVIPISGRTGDNIAALEKAMITLLPAGPFLFPQGQITDRDQRFFAAEIIREKLMRKLGGEVPYRLGVIIEEFVAKREILHIGATIWVERSGQKQIVIGKKGTVLKAIGEQARKDMEKMFGNKVFLRTWVKVKEKWSDDIRALQQLGFSVTH